LLPLTFLGAAFLWLIYPVYIDVIPAGKTFMSKETSVQSSASDFSSRCVSLDPEFTAVELNNNGDVSSFDSWCL
jgi:hypothetical protein